MKSEKQNCTAGVLLIKKWQPVVWETPKWVCDCKDEWCNSTVCVHLMIIVPNQHGLIDEYLIHTDKSDFRVSTNVSDSNKDYKSHCFHLWLRMKYVCNSGPSLWSLWGFSELGHTHTHTKSAWAAIYQIHINVDSYESVLVNGPVRNTHKNVARELSSVCESRVICPVANSHAFDVSVIFVSMRYY